MVSISVVMPVYNVEISMLEEAVNSILSQTFQDFEFIIIDDASNDDTYNYLNGIKDERIILIRNSEHLGITKSLNIGLKEAKGKYIARMDGDDISLPQRFEKQYEYMESHPDVIVCGTGVEIFGERSKKYCRKISDPESYRVLLLFTNPGPMHPTAFFNRELLLRYHITYDERLECAQDYGLWTVISRYGNVFNLNDILLRYRTHNRQISSAHVEKQIACDKLILEGLLKELLGSVTKEEIELHYTYAYGRVKGVTVNAEMYSWFRRLIDTNNRVGVYNKEKFKSYVYNSVLKPIIYRSFRPDMAYISKIGMFFRYLPPHIALRSSVGMTASDIMCRLHGK